MEYTHKALIAAGYTRTDWDKEYPGWITYEPGGGFYSWSKQRPRVCFIGNNATMNNWIEEVSRWKTNFPDLYKWWTDPAQTEPFLADSGELMIKGEDPMLVEADAA
ncbi:MAG TPA: hypothetical protein VIV09_16780 [Pseudolabrys sp.]